MIDWIDGATLDAVLADHTQTLRDLAQRLGMGGLLADIDVISDS